MHHTEVAKNYYSNEGLIKIWNSWPNIQIPKTIYSTSWETGG